jgi:tRNA(Arg) A34 adenosine deaminase TadA
MPPEMQAAIDIAVHRKDERSFHIGCAIRRGDGVLVRFANSPNKGEIVPSHHAEARCARKATPKSVAYIARVTKEGKLSMSKPCPSCENRLRAAGVKVVFYTNWVGEIERMSLG